MKACLDSSNNLNEPILNESLSSLINERAWPNYVLLGCVQTQFIHDSYRQSVARTWSHLHWQADVDCLKITVNKSSDNKVHASDARLIKVTRAMPKHRARSLWHPSNVKTQGLKPASQHHFSAQIRSSRHASNITKHRVWGRVSTPLWHPNAELRTRVQHHFNG